MHAQEPLNTSSQGGLEGRGSRGAGEGQREQQRGFGHWSSQNTSFYCGGGGGAVTLMKR